MTKVRSINQNVPREASEALVEALCELHEQLERAHRAGEVPPGNRTMTVVVHYGDRLFKVEKDFRCRLIQTTLFQSTPG